MDSVRIVLSPLQTLQTDPLDNESEFDTSAWSPHTHIGKQTVTASPHPINHNDLDDS